jgi:small subunit ribosomal protein S16
MLVIRLQRIGRSGHAMFRVVVQDSRKSPKSGSVVSLLGSYDPHAKKVTLKKDVAQKFLDNGAQPSNRVISLLQNEGLKLPSWVEKSLNKERTVRNPEKRRSTSPKVEEPAQEVAAPVEAATEEPVEEKVAETPASEEVKEEDSTQS